LTYTNITIEPYGELKVDEGVPEKERETGSSLVFLGTSYIIWLFCSQTLLDYLTFQSFSILSVPDEDYSRNLSCTLNLISTFLFLVT